MSAWERLVHPDDRQLADRAHESVAKGATTYEAEFRLKHKDGRYIHVLSRGFPVRRGPGGPVVRIVGTHFDLTKRRAGRGGARADRAPCATRVRARGRAPPHCPRDARSVRRAADDTRARAGRAAVGMRATGRS